MITPGQEDREAALLRRVITRRLSDVELSGLCHDNFPRVYETFTEGMQKDARVLKLVNYCKQHHKLDELRTILLEERPDLSDDLPPIPQPLPSYDYSSLESYGPPEHDDTIFDIGPSEGWSLEPLIAAIKQSVDQYIPKDRRTLDALLAGLGGTLVLIIIVILFVVLRGRNPENTAVPTVPVLRGGAPGQLQIREGEAASIVTDSLPPEPLLISVQRCFSVFGQPYCRVQFNSRLASRSEVVQALDCVIVRPFYVAIADIRSYWILTATVTELTEEFEVESCVINPTPTPLP